MKDHLKIKHLKILIRSFLTCISKYSYCMPNKKFSVKNKILLIDITLAIKYKNDKKFKSDTLKYFS